MMAALANGFLRRIAHEARSYADGRRIGPGPLSEIRFARYRLAAIDAAHTIATALNHHLQTRLNVTADMSGTFPVVQALKTVATERMITAAHHYQQLVGGEGYRNGSPTNIAAQAFLDTRVFTIFDGTNDLLSQQLAEHCRARATGQPLSQYLARWPATAPGIADGRLDLRFLDRHLDQEHLVLAGRAIAYTIAATLVQHWGSETGADPAGRPRRDRVPHR